MVLFVAVGVCAVLAMLLVYRYDLYDREPWYLLAGTAAAGAAMMWLAGEVEVRLLDQLHDRPWPAVHIAAVAAVCEEVARLIIVAFLALFVRRQFNDPMDGIIYGSAAGLGMAVLESIAHLHVIRAVGPLPPPSELVRLLGHLVMGGITGFALGMARMKMPHWRRVLVGCVAFSIALHFLWDWIAFTTMYAGGKQWWHTLGAVAIITGGMLFYGVLVVTGSDWSRTVFAPHSRRALWGWPLTLIVSKKNRARPAPPEEIDQ